MISEKISEKLVLELVENQTYKVEIFTEATMSPSLDFLSNGRNIVRDCQSLLFIVFVWDVATSLNYTLLLSFTI